MRVPTLLPLLVLLALASLGGCLELPSLSKPAKSIKNAIGSSVGAVKGATNITKNGISIAADATHKGVLIAADSTNKAVKGAVNSTQDAVKGAINSTQVVAKGAINSTQDAVKGAINSTQDAVKGAINSTQEVVVGVKDSVVDVITPDDVCYDGLGCFSMSAPWFTILRPLPKPQSPESIDAKFYLYTRKYPGRYTVTWRFNNKTDADDDADDDDDDDDGGMTVAGSDFDGSKKTFFITHGFASNGNSSWLSDMKDALLKRFDANVFLVDWGKGASLLNYFQVAANTRVVGALLAKLAHQLVQRHNADPARMHAIGHSLGAQISAYFAKNITTLGRLTALDPAQPAFEHYDRRVRLDADDAALVDVVHTSARPFVPFAGLGMVAAHGHIDFFMNGGWKQPGCYWPEQVNITSFLDLAKVPVEALSNLLSCPHGRSYEFFTASLASNNTFWGHRIDSFDKFLSTLTGGYGARLLIPSGGDADCDAESCSPFGYDAFDFPARGKFGVATTAGFPFVVAEPKVDAIMRRHRGVRPRRPLAKEQGTTSPIIPEDSVDD